LIKRFKELYIFLILKFSIRLRSILDFLFNKYCLTNKKPGNHIFVICQPKSGSTFMSNVLSKITNYKLKQFRPKPIDNLNEQDIYFPEVINCYFENTITQQHTRATNYNISMLKILSAKIIVLTRNIFDVVISTLDHNETHNIKGSTMMYANIDYTTLKYDDKLNMIIDLAIPWHIHFYVSWYDAFRKSKIDFLWITYEEFILDQETILKKILKFAGVEYFKNNIEDSISYILESKEKSRFNRGQIGRGEKILNTLQKNKIIGYTKYYSWVDFSKIGIN